MKTYKYKATNQSGKIFQGKTVADSDAKLIEFLQDSNLEVIEYSIERQSILTNFLSPKINYKELITLFNTMSQLTKAGVGILESLIDVRDCFTSQVIKDMIQHLHDDVKSGSLLSEAMAKYPKIFDKIFIGLVGTAEKTGNLNIAFENIAKNLKWNFEMKKKTTKALRYPLFSLLVMFIVLLIMTSVVVPKVTSFLLEQNIDLPAMTTSLISFSSFMQNYSWVLVIFLILFIFIYSIIRKLSKNFCIVADALKLRIPVFGGVAQKLDMSRFCQFFSITFNSGLPILECIDSARASVRNVAVNENIIVIKNMVSDGVSISEAIKKSPYFPNLVIRMFKIGEESGNMEAALDNIQFFYDGEINESIEKAVGMIQPTLTLFMGGMMAWITVAVFGPIYSSFGSF
jgi:type IV pilus assembly protein PilC